jgi:hypothetical protein
MKDVYTSNPALGDPASIEGQLSESGTRLDRLRKELAQFQQLLEEFTGTLPTTTTSTSSGRTTPQPNSNGRRSVTSTGRSPSSVGTNPHHHHNNNNNNRLSVEHARNGGSAASSDRHSLSDDGGESLSRSASDSSVSNPTNPNEARNGHGGRRLTGGPSVGGGGAPKPSSNG